ncbi:MAG: hypothetical protein JW934_10815 [Anaerolineae bacterium]|nr:hypothetical protein [Anaerolineae bacterium]
MQWEEPVEEKKQGAGIGNLGAVLFVILTVIVGLCYLTIFVNPQIMLNPFKPPQAIIAPTATTVAVAGVTQIPPTFTPPPTYPPTWTPTATPTPTATRTPTLTPKPTSTPGPLPQFSLYWDPIYTSQRLYADQKAAEWWTGVAGEITDKNGKPVPDEIVKVWDDQGHVWETKSGDASAYADKYGSAMGGHGTYAWWEQFLYDSCKNSFPVHVQVIRNGKGASPVVNVKTTGDCSKNLILIHFRKNY